MQPNEVIEREKTINATIIDVVDCRSKQKITQKIEKKEINLQTKFKLKIFSFGIVNVTKWKAIVVSSACF